MAKRKRKRLSPAAVMGGAPSPTPADVAASPRPVSRPPIADVSGDTAQAAALQELSDELRSAREDGRMVLELPLDQVDEAHLVRDRVELDPDEMAVLKESLRERGQQTAIEVVQLAPERYGLISGWRRLTALRELEREGRPFHTIQALIRQPGAASDAYRAMVEENEIRAGLSFYERARIAVQSARQGIYKSSFHAVQGLFSAARSSKRSKIMSFTALVDVLDDKLRFPSAIPEKLGLALAAQLQSQDTFRRTLSEALRKASIETAADERAVLERVLKKAQAESVSVAERPAPKPAEVIAPGLKLAVSANRIAVSGKSVDEDLVADLRDWLAARYQR